MSDLDNLHKTLGNFKRMIRIWFFTTGCCYVLVSAGLCMFLSILLDRAFRFDWSQRLICLFIGFIYIGFTIYHYIIVPLFEKISDEYLCLSIEKRKPELSQKITSGYQLANLDQPEVYGYSHVLVESTIKECLVAINNFKIKELIDQKLQLKLLACGVLSVALIFIFSIKFETEFSIWFKRNILLENIKWPRKTILKINGVSSANIIYVPENDPYELLVQANKLGVIPDLINIKVMDGQKIMNLATNLRGENEYLYRFEKVSSNFKIIVSGGDDESELIQFVTIQKPEIDKIIFKCNHPTYTGLPEKELILNQSSWVILENSTLSIEGITNKEIVRAELIFNNEILTKVPTIIKEKKFSIIINEEKLKSGSYEIKVFDQNGITKDPGISFFVTILQDKLPELKVKMDYNSEIITPQAIVPFKWFVKDDFGVRNIYLNLNILNKEEKSGDKKKILLLDNLNRNLKEFDNQINLSLIEYQLEPHQQIILFVEANDFFIRDSEVATRSVVTRFSVVSIEEFEKYIFEKEQEFRIEIERLKKEEESLQVATASILEKVKTKLAWENAEIKELMNIEKKQKLMELRNLRVINKFEQLLVDLKVNKIEDENQNNKKRIDEKIKSPLLDLNDRLIPLALEKSLEVKMHEKLTNKMASISQLIQLQGEIIRQYSEILKSMRKWEGYYETVGLLKDIIKEQKALKEQTENKTKENIKGVFDE